MAGGSQGDGSYRFTTTLLFMWKIIESVISQIRVEGIIDKSA